MKIISVLFLVLIGCNKPVAMEQALDCAIACVPLKCKAMVNHSIKGEGCLCSDEEEIWLEP